MPEKKTRKTSPTTKSDQVKPITTAPHQPMHVRGKTRIHAQYVLILSKVEKKKRSIFGSADKDDALDLFPSERSSTRGGLVPLLLAPILLCVALYGFVAFGTAMTMSGHLPEPSPMHRAFCVVLDIAQTFGIDVDDEQKAARCAGTVASSAPAQTLPSHSKEN
ncbi:MAG: hypothetical protein AAFQ15_10660 [Pseudomonadota bacterium]